MKQIKKLLLTLLMLLIGSSVANAYDFAAENSDGVTIYYNILSDTEVAVTSGNNRYSGIVNIPSNVSYNGSSYSVTSIDNLAFYDCVGLMEVTIPNSVTSIGSQAFIYSTGLTSVTIGNSVTSIGSSAFFGCKNLTAFYGSFISEDNRCLIIDGELKAFAPYGLSTYSIPNSVTSIGSSAFNDCTRLTSVTIPESVTSIGNAAFYNCTRLTEVTIPNSVTFIGSDAFYGCNGLVTVNFNATNCKTKYTISGEGVPRGVFNQCDALTTVNIGDNVTVIPDMAFTNCTGLTEVTIGNSVTEIGGSAFSGCTGLTSVTIPNSVTSIGVNAFLDCTGLTSVTIPNSVTSIGKAAFQGCAGLTEVTIPNSVTSIGNSAFEGCTGLTEVTIGSSIANIGGNAFKNCTSLGIINALPINAPAISENTFDNGTYSTAKLNLQEGATQSYALNSVWSKFINIFVDGKSPRVSDNVFRYMAVDSNSQAVLVDVIDKSMTTVTIPSRVVIEDGDGVKLYQVTAIGCGAFQDMTSLTTLKLPANLTTIGDSAFKGCTSLTALNLPSKVETIGASAFKGCSRIKSITFPEGAVEIGNLAFYYCSALADVNTINATTIGEQAFQGTKLSAVDITAQKIGSWAFYQISTLTSASLDCIELGVSVFNSTGLTAITLPESLTKIGAYAFKSSRLAEVVIPSNVEYIGNDAFGNISNLRTFYIHDADAPIELANSIVYGSPIDLIYIGRDYEGSAFAANGMKTLNIGNSVTGLPEGAFQNSRSLKTVTFGSALEAIPANAFKGCSSLTDIVVPRNVTSIGANAFDGCTAVGNIAIGCGTTEIGELAFNEVNAAASVCVAAVTPPAANNNSFSNYNVPLYVPEGSTDAYYNYPRCWYRFEPEPLKIINNVTITGAGSIVDLEPGESIKLSAVIEPIDASLPYIFWRSTNPAVAYVDSDGNVRIPTQREQAISTFADTDNECEIIAETLYADAPIAKITIKTPDNAGLDDVVVDKPVRRANDIYTLQGVCIKRDATDYDIKSLAPGFYIVGGRKVLVK